MWRPLKTDGQALPGCGHAERALQVSWWQEHGAAHAGGPRAQQAGKLETRALFAGSQGGTVARAGGDACGPLSARLDLKAPGHFRAQGGSGLLSLTRALRQSVWAHFGPGLAMDTAPIDTIEEIIHYPSVNFLQGSYFVHIHGVAGDTPNTVNTSVVRTKRYLTGREVEKLMEAARKHGRYGHRDATMILLAYRNTLNSANSMWRGGTGDGRVLWLPMYSS